MSALLLASLCLSTIASHAKEAAPSVNIGRFVASFDSVTLPENERLGLLGTSYLREINPYLAAGMGIYSAISGVRGGFFTGGVAIDGNLPFIRRWRINGSLFVGGGGGGAAPQGGGLMVRPQAGLLYQADQAAFGLGVARVWFPNGSIDTTQMIVTFARQFHDDFVLGWDAPRIPIFSSVSVQADVKRRELAMQHQWYFSPHSRYRRRSSGNSAIPLLGARWRAYGDDASFYELQALGAWGGASDGYAEWDIGFGRINELGNASALFSSIALGAAGGGGIDTAGGLLVRGSAGWAFPLVDFWPVRGFVDVGYLTSVEAHYSAYTASMGVEYGYRVPRAAADATAWQAMRVRPSIQRYLLQSNAQKMAPHVEPSVDLVQLKLDWLVFRHFYVGVQASGAFSGGVGGYATGMMGAGLCIYCSSDWSINGEGYVGAAGGGGMPVGGGAITQTQISFHHHINTWLEWTFGAGLLAAPHAPLRAWQVETGAAIRLSAPRL